MLQSKIFFAENQNIFYFRQLLSFVKIRAVCEIIWKKCGRTRQVTDNNTIRRMRFFYLKLRRKHTHTPIILNIFPLQHWLGQCSSMLYYTGWSKKSLYTWRLQYKSSGAQRFFDHPVRIYFAYIFLYTVQQLSYGIC
jgi:hypothetical protein